MSKTQLFMNYQNYASLQKAANTAFSGYGHVLSGKMIAFAILIWCTGPAESMRAVCRWAALNLS
jgi:hypothetical protein